MESAQCGKQKKKPGPKPKGTIPVCRGLSNHPCGVVLTDDNWNRSSKKTRDYLCKGCDRTVRKVRKRKHPEWTWAYYCLKNRQKGATKKGVRFSLNRQQIHRMAMDTPYCPICAVRLKYDAVGWCAESATLDEMLPGLGYGENESWIICSRCNCRKNDSFPNMMRRIADVTEAECAKRGISIPTPA